MIRACTGACKHEVAVAMVVNVIIREYSCFGGSGGDGVSLHDRLTPNTKTTARLHCSPVLAPLPPSSRREELAWTLLLSLQTYACLACRRMQHPTL
jgi:hypothetical protein